MCTRIEEDRLIDRASVELNVKRLETGELTGGRTNAEGKDWGSIVYFINVRFGQDRKI